MSDVREIPDYRQCRRSPDDGHGQPRDGAFRGCLRCTTERDAAVDALVEAACEVDRERIKRVRDGRPQWSPSWPTALDKLHAALARFGGEQ